MSDQYRKLIEQAKAQARASVEGVALPGDRTPVTDAIARWDGTYTTEALTKVHYVEMIDMLSGRKSDGKGRIRSSKIGGCIREQAFSYLGHEPDEAPVEVFPNYASHGTALHLQWQKMGLSAGIFTDVEVDAVIPEWDFRGQADAVLTDGSVFELKTTGEAELPRIEANGPKHAHILQATAYMLALGAEEASIVYDARGRRVQFVECRIRVEERIVDELRDIVDTILEAGRDISTLPGMLEGCRTRSGTAWRYCSFRDACMAQSRNSQR